MLTDAATIKYLDNYYSGELPADGIKFTMSLLSKGVFSARYKAQCVMKILYLEDSLKHEYITSKGWNVIHCALESEADTAYESVPMLSQKQQSQDTFCTL